MRKRFEFVVVGWKCTATTETPIAPTGGNTDPDDSIPF
jgi:hypothetical protein